MKKFVKNYIFQIIIILFLLFFHVICILSIPKYSAKIIDVGITNYGIDDIAPHVVRENVLNKLTKNLSDVEKEIILSSYKNIKKINLSKDEYRDLIRQYPILIEEDIYTLISSNELEIKDILKNNVLSLMINNNNLIKESYTDTAFNKFIIDEYKVIGLSLDNIQIQYILKMGLYLISFLTCSFILLIILTYLSTSILSKTSKIICEKVYQKILSLSKKKIIENNYSHSFERIIDDIKNIDNCHILIYLIYIIIITPIILIRLFNINTIIGIILLITTIIMIILIVIPTKLFVSDNINTNNYIDRSNYNIKKIISKIYIFKKYNNIIDEEKNNYDNQLKSSKLIKKITCSFKAISLLFIAIILIVLIICKIKISIGNNIAIIMYTIILIISYLKIFTNINELSLILVSIRRIKRLMDTDSVINIKSANKQRINDGDLGSIIFKNVFLKYPNALDYELENISFIINSGEKVVITGLDNGKNVISDLITKSYDISKGKIIVNGFDIKKISLTTLNEKIGYVQRDIGIVNDSIIFNLKMAKDEITSETIEHICELVDIKSYILNKKDKYNYILSNNISTGQKQKILIARAIIKNPDIYIFDDAWTNINSSIENRIKNYLSSKTIITISKEASELINADKIIVIDKGKIVAIGKHEDLINNCDIYYKIIFSQLEGDK